MALDLNKDPYTYAKDYEGFIQDLKQFLTNRGSPFVKIPQLAGKDIDLYLLYRRVIALGGWQKVNDESRWEEIQEEFRIPRGCTNGATALKQIYIRYLDLYEKVHFLGADPKYERMEYDEETAARKKSTSVLHGVPLHYNQSQHHISQYVRQNAGFSCDLVQVSDYYKLENSFLSGLPNEVDFAMNVCLLLSNEGKHVLKLGQSRHLLELMLAQVGIFKEGPGSLAKIYEEGWKVATKRDFVKFWYDTVKEDGLRTLILPTDSSYTPKEIPGQDVLNLGREIGINDVEGQRVLQMAVIFRNLSFELDNCKIMASNPLVFRFLMLCSHSKFGCLKQIGLDTVGNIASQFVLSAAVDDSVNILLDTVCRCLVSADKFEVVRGLEILSKLCQVEKNEDILAEKVQRKSYEDIVQLLTIHDIQLIVYTLEALYQLSELGEVATTHIASVKNAVDVLVSLITVEAQSYGPSSLVGIKVVEYVPPPQAPEALPGSSGPPPTPQPAPPSAPVTPRQVSRQSHIKATTPAQKQPIPADSESFACNWLKSNYEYKEDGQLSQVSMYSEYLAFCGRIPIKDVVASAAFIDCIRAVFSQADQSSVEKGGNKEVHIRGVAKRALPLPVAIPAPGIGQYQTTPKGAENSINKGITPSSSQGFPQPPSSPSPSFIAQGNQQMPSPTPPLPGSPLHSPDQSPNRPMTILQQQLQTPPQNSPAYKKTKRQKSSKFPSIKKALHGTVSPQKHNGSPNQYSDTDSSPGSTPKKPTDSNMIKTLLAKKLNQNMIRHNAAAAAAAMQSGDPPSSPVAAPVQQQQQQQQPWQHQQVQPGHRINPSLSQPNYQMNTQPVHHQTHHQTGPTQLVHSNQEQYGIGANVHTESQHMAPSPHPAPLQQSMNQKWDSSQPQLPERTVQHQPCNTSTHPDSMASISHGSLAGGQTLPDSPHHILESSVVSKPASPKQLSSTGSRPGSPRSLSPRSLRNHDLEVCGEVECAKDIVQQANETKIECIENKVLNEQKHISELVCDSRAHMSRPSEAPSPAHDASSRDELCADPTLSNSSLPKDGAEPKKELNGAATGFMGSVVCPSEMTSPADRLPCNRSEEVGTKTLPSSSVSLVNGCYDDSSKDSDASFQLCEGNVAPLPGEDIKPLLTRDTVSKLVNGIENDSEIEKMKNRIADAPSLKDEINKYSPSLEKAAKLVQSKNGIVNHYGNGDYFSTDTQGSSEEIAVGGVMDSKLNGPAVDPPSQEGEGPVARVPLNGSVINGELNCEDDSLGSVSNQSAPAIPHKVMQKSAAVQDTSMETDVASLCLHNKTNSIESVDNNKPCAMEVDSSGTEQTLQSEPVTSLACQSNISPSCTTTKDAVADSANDCKSPMETTQSTGKSTTPAKVKKKHSISKQGSAEKGSTSSKKSKSTEKEKKPKARKRSRSNASTGESQCSSMASSTGAELACEWNGCKRMFEMPKSVFSHAYGAHLSNCQDEVCKWEGCDKLQRKKWSLITHLQDHHCSEQALKQAAQRRQQAAGQMGSSVAQQPASGQAAPAALVYPPDAAIQAIRRFSARPPFQELVEPREGPVTKHIRLTAALVLRNLARYSSVGRSLIKKHERQISYSALSAVESSSALANCLWAALHDH